MIFRQSREREEKKSSIALKQTKGTQQQEKKECKE